MEAGEEAFGELLEFVRKKNQAAAECLENWREGIMAFHGFDVLSTVNVTYLNTTVIECHPFPASGGEEGAADRMDEME